MSSRQKSSFLDPSAISRHQQLTAQKARTTQIAKDEEAAIRARLRKKGLEHSFPTYRFIDFIGKGTYGRVYQASDLSHKPQRDVAIKIMNLDDVDYNANAVEKDETLKDVKNEINILSQLKDAGARNVNLIYDVLEVDGQLWIVCEHCPGGSLRTLLRASQNKCEEKYIKVVARELAIGLAAIHEANVIHRDLKAANVMIHEKGRLQIIDFGVAGAVESKTDKRKTFIGTPWWMAPEQHMAKGDQKYGFEVDVWAYAITLYEIATGAPPLSQLPPNRLAQGLRRSPPRLSSDTFSQDLCDFFEFVAQVNSEDRPTIQKILEHQYIQTSITECPTSILKDLVDKFLDWSLLGGQRTSLFIGSGAQGVAEIPNDKPDDVDFIFSTSRDMMQEYDPSYDPFAHSPPGTLSAPIVQIDSPPSPSEGNAHAPRDSQDSSQKEKRVARGGHALEALFDESQEPYEYNVRSADMLLDRPIISRAKSDLPLRNSDSSSSDLSRKELDVSDSNSKSDFEIADADTIKQKRKQPTKGKRDTMGWQPDWSSVPPSEIEESASREPMPSVPMMRPPLIHSETAPVSVAHARASTATLNLDDMMGDDDWMAGSAIGSFTSLPTPMQEVAGMDFGSDKSHHKDGFNSYASSLADISASEDESVDNSREDYAHQNREWESTMLRRTQPHERLPLVEPPNPAAMRDDAPPELIQSELGRFLHTFMDGLDLLGKSFPKEDSIEDMQEHNESGDERRAYEPHPVLTE